MNISEDQIIRSWTLNDEDKTLIRKLNMRYRSYVAVQTCFLKINGRFLGNIFDLSCEVIFHINKQLGIPKSAQIFMPDRKATLTEYRKAIFSHLGFKKFDEGAKDILHSWISSINHSTLTEEDLYGKVCHYLMQKKISLPSTKQLERLISSIRLNEYQSIFDNANSG